MYDPEGDISMTKMSYIEAIQNAQDLAIEKIIIFYIREDVGRKGGVFGATRGLQENMENCV